MRRALTLLIFLLAAAPAQAQDLDRDDRASATEALQTAQQLAQGRGVRSGRELSPALQQLAAQRSDLSAAQRAQADQLLARPTDPDDVAQPGGPYATGAPVKNDCSDAHFCVHWVETTRTPRRLADTSPANGRPDYVDDMIESFQHVVRRREHAARLDHGQERRHSRLDATRAATTRPTSTSRTSATTASTATRAPDPSQSGRSRYAFLVMDNDYKPRSSRATPTRSPRCRSPRRTSTTTCSSTTTTPRRTRGCSSPPRPGPRRRSSTRSTTTSSTSGRGPTSPTSRSRSPGDGVPPSSDDLKMYGSAIWNHWLDGIYGPSVVRQAWAISQANSVAGGGFAPARVRPRDPRRRAAAASRPSSRRSRPRRPSGMRPTAASARARRSRRRSPGAARSRPAARRRPGLLDHTAFALYDVPVPSGVGDLHLTGGLPARHVGSDRARRHRPAARRRAW